MKFIFPQNYNFNYKLFGFIDYTTIFLNIFFGLIIYLISNIFNNLYLKLCFFIILFFPFLLVSIIGFNNEKILYIIKYIYLYIKLPKYYIYKKF